MVFFRARVSRLGRSCCRELRPCQVFVSSHHPELITPPPERHSMGSLTHTIFRLCCRLFCMNRTPHVAVVGATGAVGIEMLKTLEKRNFPAAKLTLLASARSIDKKLNFRGQELA